MLLDSGWQPVQTSPPGFGALAHCGTEPTGRQGARTGPQQRQEQRHRCRTDYEYRALLMLIPSLFSFSCLSQARCQARQELSEDDRKGVQEEQVADADN